MPEKVSERKMNKDRYDGMSKDARKAWWKDTHVTEERKQYVKHLLLEALDKAKDVQGYLLLLNLGDGNQLNAGGGWDANNMAKSFIADRGV